MESPKRLRARLTLLLLVIFAAMASSGCYLQLLILSIGTNPGGYPFYEDSYTATVGTTSILANCDNDEVSSDEFLFAVGCSYVIEDHDSGLFLDITSTFDLVTEFGFFGYLIDPVILQVPHGVGLQSALLTSGTVPVPLVVTETQNFAVTPELTANAEGGMKFIILELPQSVADSIDTTDIEEGRELKFDLTFATTSLPFQVKTLFTVRVDTPDARYYLPTLPCTSNFAEIPEATFGFSLAQAASETAFGLAEEYAEMACDGQVYDLREAPEPPPQGAYRLFMAAVASD